VAQLWPGQARLDVVQTHMQVTEAAVQQHCMCSRKDTACAAANHSVCICSSKSTACCRRTKALQMQQPKHCSTSGSHVIPQRSTDEAELNLTSVIGREPVCCESYDRSMPSELQYYIYHIRLHVRNALCPAHICLMCCLTMCLLPQAASSRCSEAGAAARERQRLHANAAAAHGRACAALQDRCIM